MKYAIFSTRRQKYFTAPGWGYVDDAKTFVSRLHADEYRKNFHLWGKVIPLPTKELKL